MDKILEMLGITKLDEADQEKLKTELEAIIESKATEKSKEMEDDIKEKVVEEMETKFDNYKEDITAKFSNFLDDLLEEELVLPENILEYARLGEEYQPLIENFKTKLAIDEGILDNEVKGILKEAKNEIVELTSKNDEMVSENLDNKSKLEKVMTENYLLKKCDGLTPKQKEKVFNILEGASKEDIDKKFDILVKINEEDDEFETKECPECGTENPEDATKCKECGTPFDKKKKDDDDDDKDKDDKKKNESKTYIDENKTLDESNPKSLWLKVLREKTF